MVVLCQQRWERRLLDEVPDPQDAVPSSRDAHRNTGQHARYKRPYGASVGGERPTEHAGCKIREDETAVIAPSHHRWALAGEARGQHAREPFSRGRQPADWSADVEIPHLDPAVSAGHGDDRSTIE